ncbi:cell adhesion molecule 2-like [Ruditapes philippinarum]|uniref:cell adhesion molecule 2-like n=1 Tax=Ruditapes philippinarum TaxID=129788 RepID=UPI00295B9E1E|nr:cell adhesion molecule 2-like [Ruditapes philippinarum]
MAELRINTIFSCILSVVLCTAQDIHQLTVTAGDNVTLSCTSTTDYPTWFGPELYDGNVQQYNNHGQSSFPNPKVPEQKRLRLGWANDKRSLIISDLIFSDRGLYQCVTVAKINMSVRVPPQSPMISNTEISAGDTLIIRKSESQVTSLVCISSGGYPQPLVQWYRGNTGTQPITSSSAVSTGNNSYNVTQTYTFTPQRQDDGVKYICQSSFRTAPRHISTSSVELFLYCE